VNSLAPGLLIAMPQLGDPNFSRVVVLMVEHGESGSMGIVINRATPLTLKDLAKGQALPLSSRREADAVFEGGPVEAHRGFVLHDIAHVPERHEVLPGLYLSMTSRALEPLLLEEKGHVRVCLGYAGWGPKQLENEIAQGAWLFTEAAPASLWGAPPDELWDATLRGMGVEPAMLFSTRGVN
jgi:putative transcriptional regulator